MATIEDRIKWTWPDAGRGDILQIGPLGSRTTDNILLYNRRTNEVATGVRPGPIPSCDPGGVSTTVSCFKNTLPVFATAVEEKYTSLILSSLGDAPRYERLRAEYRVVILMLASLPPLP